MEGAIGRAILGRDGSGARLTGDGQALLGYARRAAALSDEVRRHFSGLGMRGRLRVA